MGDNIISSVVGILTAIVGLAIIAVVLSKNSYTSQTIGAAGSAFQSILGKAVSPVSN
jgi:hypothetical protein